MAKTAVVVDQEYLKHRPGDAHPERPERIKVLLNLAAELDGAKFHLLAPAPARRADIEATHGCDYVRLIEATTQHNSYALDGDTITCRDSFGVALLAVGGFLRLLDAIAAKEVQNGFALVRPPGHHALRQRAMGFCLFNTMAIGAEYLRRAHGAKRVMIVDWDVHHGNGTQDEFYSDGRVMYFSTHMAPFYPGSGAEDEKGKDKGAGCIINVPLAKGTGDDVFKKVYDEKLKPAALAFKPDFILISAGFDSARGDLLGHLDVTPEGYAAMTRKVREIADATCKGRIVSMLEGGYNLEALANSVEAHVRALME